MNEKKQKLEKELRYLLKDVRDEEIKKYSSNLENEDVKVIAQKIYNERGIDYSSLDTGLLNNISKTITDLMNVFKGKDKQTRNKMILEIVYIVVLLILIKIPFDLVKDIGYEYIALLSQNHVISILWELAFLILYTIVIVCTFIVLIRNFNAKYRNVK